MIGVLKKQPQSEWASPTYIVAKKQGTPRVLSDFRQVNKRIKRNPYPIPKISSVLQEMEGFTFATQLDLNMGYYTIRLDPDAQKICTIIFPWGKYSYLRLPMGISCAPDIFQEKMSTLMETLEYVKDFLDKKEIAYFVREQQALIFIYKEKDPDSMYSSRYAYYYTTGRWGSDKRRKHYHSDGIEHFMSTYYTTVEQDKKYWDDLKDQKDKDE